MHLKNRRREGWPEGKGVGELGLERKMGLVEEFVGVGG